MVQLLTNCLYRKLDCRLRAFCLKQSIHVRSFEKAVYLYCKRILSNIWRFTTLHQSNRIPFFTHLSNLFFPVENEIRSLLYFQLLLTYRSRLWVISLANAVLVLSLRFYTRRGGLLGGSFSFLLNTKPQ